MRRAVGAHEFRKYYRGPAVPPNEALIAFLQLVKTQLRVLQASLCLTDGSTLHVVAASQALDDDVEIESGGPPSGWSLESGDTHLWMDLVEQTMNLSNETRPGRRLFKSTLDANQDVRFFAGLPLTTALGIPIGALVIVDTRTRDITDKQIAFLERATSRSMQQLESLREIEVKRRLLRMSEGIDSFVQHRESTNQTLPEQRSSEDNGRNAKSFVPGYHDKDALQGKHANTPDAEEVTTTEGHRDVQQTTTSFSNKAAASRRKDVVPGETTYRKTFRRAAEILRTCLELDGTLFVNGYIGVRGPNMPTGEPDVELQKENVQVEDRKRVREEAENSDQPHLAKRIFTSADFRKDVYTQRPAEVLGFAVRPGVEAPSNAHLAETVRGLSGMDEQYLLRFLQRHPEGRTWYFDEEGVPYRFKNDEVLTPEEDRGADSDGHRLAKCFPGVRQVIFSPLTDPVTLKHLAGCFAWTQKVYPVLTAGSDLWQFKTFLHSVVAELSRLDTVAAVKQQAAFVSSISHELRSPLHAILGAAELLHDTQLTRFQEGLADTISSCGTTLHDTLSNVLSYAKINDFEEKLNRAQQNQPKDSPWALENKESQNVLQEGPTSDLFVPTDLAMLCEEIVEVVESGYMYGRKGTNGSPSVTLDIAYQEHWTYLTEPGALRRIMMNIIGNAIKYSPEGSVTVSLSAISGKELEDTDDDPTTKPLMNEAAEEKRFVIFTVADSGKGMSKDFLENQLFLPFRQEHAVKSEGVGLGMSIVKSLVSLLAGKIEVRSEVNKGTEFKISFPMGAASAEKDDLPLERNVAILRDRKFTIALYGFGSDISKSIQNYLEEWFYCKVMPLDKSSGHRMDILILDGTNQEAMVNARKHLKNYDRRLGVVRMYRGKPEDEEEESVKYFAKNHTLESVPRPFGPYKVSKAILSCLDRLREFEESGVDPDAESKGHQDPAPEDESPPEKEEGSKDRREVVREHQPPPSKVARQGNMSFRESRRRSVQLTSVVVEPESEPSAEPTPRPSILLVEDNLINLRLLKSYLQKNGYTNIETAVDGQKAVEAVRKRREGFDIIITDMSMPVMDGFEAARHIRTIERERTLDTQNEQERSEVKQSLLIALTGLASVNDRDEALKAGIDMFLPKPLKFDRLGALLESWKMGQVNSD